MDGKVAAALDAFANRKIYSTLDANVLRSIKDDDVEQAVMDYAFSKLDGHDDQEEAVLAGLPPGVRALFHTWIVDAEVSNGGFNQYYFNTESEHAEAAVEAFEFFGAPQHASLMKEANAIWSREKSEMAKFKDAGTLEAFSESYEHTNLGPLDDRFYKLPEDLSRLRIARIRQSPELFSGD